MNLPFISSFLRRKWVRGFLLSCAGICLLGGLAILVSELYVHSATADRMYYDIDPLPAPSVGLVLGCASRLSDGRENHYFRNRIKAAAELWRSGKLSSIIVSGDNRWDHYSEPDDMKDALVALGVPPDLIVCDYAGLRTLDSVVRAKEIFGAGRIIIVSQPYHNSRALAIARHNGMDAYAYNAEEIYSRAYRAKSWVRERAARVAMMLDLWVLNTRPRHMGEPERLPERERSSSSSRDHEGEKP